MRTLLIAAATAVGFALPAAAATFNNTSPGSNSPGYNTPSYNQQSNDQQNNGANFSQRDWANGQQGAQNNSGFEGQNQNQMGQNTVNIRRQIYENLSQAGFSDIRIMPRAFLVHAKDRQGNPVVMMITPNSVMALTAAPGNNGQAMNNQGRFDNQQNGFANNGNGSMNGNGNGGSFGNNNNNNDPGAASQ
jgi:hypothetical protein